MIHSSDNTTKIDKVSEIDSKESSTKNEISSNSSNNSGFLDFFKKSMINISINNR